MESFEMEQYVDIFSILPPASEYKDYLNSSAESDFMGHECGDCFKVESEEDNLNILFEENTNVLLEMLYPYLSVLSPPNLFNDSSIHPVNDSSINPVNDFSINPVNDSSINPVNDSSINPVNDSSINPVNDFSINPVNDFSINPVNDSSINPVNGSSINPVNGSSINPVNGSSINPVNGPSINPVNDPSINPANDPVDSNNNYASDLNIYDYSGSLGDLLAGSPTTFPSPCPLEVPSDFLVSPSDTSADCDLDLDLPFLGVEKEIISYIADEVSFDELLDCEVFNDIAEDNSAPSSNEETISNLPINDWVKCNRKGKSLPVLSEPSSSPVYPEEPSYYLTPPVSPDGYHPDLDHCYCLPPKVEEKKEKKYNYWNCLEIIPKDPCLKIIPPTLKTSSQITLDSEDSSEEEIDVITISKCTIVPKPKPPPKNKGRRGRKCVKKAQVPLPAKSLKTAVQKGNRTSVRRTYNKKNVSNSVKKSPSNDLDTGEASKREQHNSAERMRREIQKDYLQKLRVCVPKTKIDPKAAKVTIINEAVKYIKSLESNKKDLILTRKEEERMCRQKIARVKSLLALFKKHR